MTKQETISLISQKTLSVKRVKQIPQTILNDNVSLVEYGTQNFHSISQLTQIKEKKIANQFFIGKAKRNQDIKAAFSGLEIMTGIDLEDYPEFPLKATDDEFEGLLVFQDVPPKMKVIVESEDSNGFQPKNAFDHCVDICINALPDNYQSWIISTIEKSRFSKSLSLTNKFDMKRLSIISFIVVWLGSLIGLSLFLNWKFQDIPYDEVERPLMFEITFLTKLKHFIESPSVRLGLAFWAFFLISGVIAFAVFIRKRRGLLDNQFLKFKSQGAFIADKKEDAAHINHDDKEYWFIVDTISNAQYQVYLPLLFTEYFNRIENKEKIKDLIPLINKENAINHLIAYFKKRLAERRTNFELVTIMDLFGTENRFDLSGFIKFIRILAMERENFNDKELSDSLYEFYNKYEIFEITKSAINLLKYGLSIPIDYFLDYIETDYKYGDIDFEYGEEIAEGLYEYIEQADIDREYLVRRLDSFAYDRVSISSFAIHLLGMLGEDAKSALSTLKSIMKDPGDFRKEPGEPDRYFQHALRDLAESTANEIDSTYIEKSRKEISLVELEDILNEALYWMDDPDDFYKKELWHLFLGRSYEFLTSDTEGLKHYHYEAVENLTKYPLEKTVPIILKKAKEGGLNAFKAIRYLSFSESDEEIKKTIIKELLPIIKENVDHDLIIPELFKTLNKLANNNEIFHDIIKMYKDEPLDFFEYIGYLLPNPKFVDIKFDESKDEKIAEIIKIIRKSAT